LINKNYEVFSTSKTLQFLVINSLDAYLSKPVQIHKTGYLCRMSQMSSGENPSADSGEEVGASASRHYTSTTALLL
jgi:hypothetical protein